MDLPDLVIKPKEFNEYLLNQLQLVYEREEQATITTIVDYGYFDELGVRADIDDEEDINDIDYRNPRIQVITLSTISSKSGKHINIDRKIYYIDISEDGRYTILSMKQIKIYSTKGVENHIQTAFETLKRIFIPFYPRFSGNNGYPIASVVTDVDSLRNIYRERGIDNKAIYRNYIRTLCDSLVGHALSIYTVIGDDGEESKWESDNDQRNRLKILYTLFSTKPYDDSLGTSRAAIINAIGNLNI